MAKTSVFYILKNILEWVTSGAVCLCIIFLSMRKFIFILVIFLSTAFVFLSFGELKSIVNTLHKGNIWYILLALLVQFGWFVVSGATYLALYRVLDLKGRVYKMTLMAVAANFVNIIAPSAGMSGIAIFISDAKRNGQSTGKATVASMLNLLLDYIAFLVVLTLGLLVLFRRNDLGPTELAASAVMFIIAIGIGFLLYLGSRSAQALGDALAWLARLVNRIIRPFIRRDYLSQARAYEFANEMATDLKSLPERYLSLIKPLLYAFANKALMILILAITFMAFDIPFTVGTIISGFSISYLFLVVSPTPSGIGIVEGIMPLALSSLRVPWSEAIIITLAYRGITFWVPLGVGAIAFRILNRSQN